MFCFVVEEIFRPLSKSREILAKYTESESTHHAEFATVRVILYITRYGMGYCSIELINS